MAPDSKLHAATRARILIVDDDRQMCQLLVDVLAEEGYLVEAVHDGRSALEKFRANGCDLMITDLMMPRMRGTELVKEIKGIDPDAVILLITAFGSIESAVEAMKAGAFHYVTKPFRTDEVILHVSRGLQQRRLCEEVQRLRSEILERNSFENIIGKSEKIREVFSIVRQTSDLAANVLILGESGTGKEMVARAIHHHSWRAQGPFIPLNCAAVPETLLESELFGYLRGTFTDARKDRRGLFQEASGGILFLDEISEIPINLQAKLLRVIEDKEVRPLECYSHRIAAATRAVGRYSASRRALLAQICASGETRDRLDRPGGAGCADELSLAGKCAGVGAHHRASGAAWQRGQHRLEGFTVAVAGY
ncbi:MAG: Fis family transcriptional regulator [Deltaproteobacteria bacterium]|nr:Fis family transcriptional regulator [Deltaproteobacteria bacterium]